MFTKQINCIKIITMNKGNLLLLNSFYDTCITLIKKYICTIQERKFMNIDIKILNKISANKICKSLSWLNASYLRRFYSRNKMHYHWIRWNCKQGALPKLQKDVSNSQWALCLVVIYLKRKHTALCLADMFIWGLFRTIWECSLLYLNKLYIWKLLC